MYKKNRESVDHILLLCEVSCAIWNVSNDSSCLGLCCFLREKNDRCFEDDERTLEELKALFFNNFYFWTAAYVFPLVINLSCFSFSFCPYYLGGFSYILLVYLGVPYAFNGISINFFFF
jgi:hypothetical protein